MTETFFTILNIQEIWESIILQVNSLFDPERFQFLGALGLFWDKILDNPLASIITILFLIGLPYTLFKAKESSTQANDRLDRLMEEMKDFEFEKPWIDLQDKFKDISIENSPVTDYDQVVAEFNLENEVPDLSIEEDIVPQDLEPASFTKQLTLDQDVTDDFLATGPLDPERETADESHELSPLAEESFDETEVSQVESRVEDEEFINQYFKDLGKKDKDRELVSVTEENIDETDLSQAESGVEDEEYASHDIDDLQTRMEQAIKKLRLKYPSPEETEETASGETNMDSAPSVPEAVEKPSNEEAAGDESNDPSPPSSETLSEEEDTSRPSGEFIPSDFPAGGQENSLKKSDLITHLKSFQKNLENRFNSKINEIKKNSNESQQEQNSSVETIHKSN